MATWRGHTSGAVAALVVPAVAATAFGGYGIVAQVPPGFAARVHEAFSVLGSAGEGETLGRTFYESLWWATLLCVGVLFGVFPDTDIGSVGRNVTWSMATFIALAVATRMSVGQGGVMMLGTSAAYAALVVAVVALASAAGHREWTHARWAAVAVPAALAGLPMGVWTWSLRAGLLATIAGVLGYLSHLFLDGLLIGRGNRTNSSRSFGPSGHDPRQP